jgi:hypothetical protein
MKKFQNSFGFLIFNFACAILFFAFAVNEQAQQQQMPPGHATDFSSDQYFEPPNGQQVKMRMSGAAAAPLPGGALDITDLKIEKFNLDGKTEAIIHAPQCTFAPFEGVANSAGRLELQTGDGKIRITGDGFLWRQSDNSLTISNHVYTIIETGILKPTAP